MKDKSVQSINLCQSLPCRQAGVILAIYDIIKIHKGEPRVESKEGQGNGFMIRLPAY